MVLVAFGTMIQHKMSTVPAIGELLVFLAATAAVVGRKQHE